MMIIETLMAIQNELKAPKSQFNKFGNYAYRNAEDILEALKPILSKYESALTLNDDIVLIGDRYYIKAVATLYCGTEHISASAFAREPSERKGMDDAQVTGATSSYARKYALNGLFAIDDTKDADTLNTGSTANEKAPTTAKASEPSKNTKTATKTAESGSTKGERPAEPAVLREPITQGAFIGKTYAEIYKAKQVQDLIADANGIGAKDIIDNIRTINAYIAAVKEYDRTVK